MNFFWKFKAKSLAVEMVKTALEHELIKPTMAGLNNIQEGNESD